MRPTLSRDQYIRTSTFVLIIPEGPSKVDRVTAKDTTQTEREPSDAAEDDIDFDNVTESVIRKESKVEE